MEHHANSYGDIEPIGTRATISSTLAAGADGLDMVTDRYVSDIYIYFFLSVSSFPFSHFSSLPLLLVSSTSTSARRCLGIVGIPTPRSIFKHGRAMYVDNWFFLNHMIIFINSLITARSLTVLLGTKIPHGNGHAHKYQCLEMHTLGRSVSLQMVTISASTQHIPFFSFFSPFFSHFFFLHNCPFFFHQLCHASSTGRGRRAC